MSVSVLVPVDYTATQFLSRTMLHRVMSKQVAEREDQNGSPTVKSIYESLIGLWSIYGDSIVGSEIWLKPTQVSATEGDLLAVKPVRTLNNTDFLATRGSAAIANALAPAQNTAIDTAISQIQEFHSLKDGWKGPNSLGPTECAIDDAKTFATMVLADSKIEPPHIGLAADVEITLFWQNPIITIDLTIAGDGTYAYFAKPDAGRPFFEDAAPVTENLPEEILCLIRRTA